MRITWNSADVFPNQPNFDLGMWSITVPDEKVKEYTEALILLGFAPEVTLG